MLGIVNLQHAAVGIQRRTSPLQKQAGKTAANNFGLLSTPFWANSGIFFGLIPNEPF